MLAKKETPQKFKQNKNFQVIKYNATANNDKNWINGKNYQ